MDCVLSLFHIFCAVRLRHVPLDSFFVTTWYASSPSVDHWTESLKETSISKALPLPDIPLDEFQLCSFQRWRVGEIIFVALSLLYGTSLPANRFHSVTTNPIFTEDVSAFGLIIWSAKYRGFRRARGVPNLLDRIVQDSTTYFLVIFTNHLVLILFELFAAVSGHLTRFAFHRSRRTANRRLFSFSPPSKSPL